MKQTALIDVPAPNYSHLLSLSGPLGTFEHANHTLPRLDHGYCCDDVARVVVVALREPAVTSVLRELSRVSVRFLGLAQDEHGRFANRRSATGEFYGPSTHDDCWGRSLWAAGTAAACSDDEDLRAEALAIFERGASSFSRHPRAMAFATFGAAEVLRVDPGHSAARELVVAAARLLDEPDLSESWCWAEPRLWYANAVLPDALVAAGEALGDDRLVALGLRRLRWLLEVETNGDVLSVTPVGGRGPNDRQPGFDQQPIEVAAIADACARAYDVTGEASWLNELERAVSWFFGANDARATMCSPLSGGGYDGLTSNGPNLNQGAESTLAFLSTLQHARRLAGSNS